MTVFLKQKNVALSLKDPVIIRFYLIINIISYLKIAFIYQCCVGTCLGIIFVRTGC